MESPDNNVKPEEEADENQELVGEPESSENKPMKHPFLHIITEAVLVIGGIPTVIMFMTGIINGILLLVENKDYMVCIIKHQLKNEGDVYDHMKDHLVGSTIVAWVLIIIYGQILFILPKFSYFIAGVLYLIAMLGGFGFHIAGIVWLAGNDCTDTHLYGMAVYNTVLFYLYFVIMITVLLTLVLKGIKSHNKQHKRVNNPRKEELGESEERMMDDRNTGRENENAKEPDDNTSGDQNNRKRPTIDPEDEEEEVNQNKDEEDEEEEEPEQKVEDLEEVY